jgi:protein ImuB
MLGSAAPARDPEHWLTLLRERLDRLVLPAPVRAIALRSEPARPLAPANGQLFPLDAAAAAPDPALLDRLRARLGPVAVQGLLAVADHRPECALRLCDPVPERVRTGADGARRVAEGRGPAYRSAKRGAQPVPTPGIATTARYDRPLWLLATPVPLATRDGRPWLDGPLDLGQGCERIDTGWWDGHPVARDYYAALTAAGERLWIYRALRGARGWYLHGVFGDHAPAP